MCWIEGGGKGKIEVVGTGGIEGRGKQPAGEGRWCLSGRKGGVGGGEGER